MLSPVGFVLILSAIAVIPFRFAAVTLGHFLGPRRPDPIKNETYGQRCRSIGDTWSAV